jgi:hypothetical protein
MPVAEAITMPIMAMTERSILNIINTSSAPTPADGRPEMNEPTASARGLGPGRS